MFSSRSILLVETDKEKSTLLARLIQEMGYTLLAAETTLEGAIQQIQHHAPDFVISAVHLHEPFQGLTLAEEIVPLALPIILISTQSDEETYRRVCALRPVAFLTGTIDFYNLKSVITLATDPEHVWPRRNPAAAKRTWAQDVIFVKSNNIIQKLRLRDILYVQADGNYSIIVAASKRIVVKMSLAQMHEMLDADNFVQVHRNYLVRVSEIDSISLSHNELSIHGHTIPISRQKFRDDLLRNVKLLR
jgi:DNA-binding LytR/AlgR family response regulator